MKATPTFMDFKNGQPVGKVEFKEFRVTAVADRVEWHTDPVPLDKAISLSNGALGQWVTMIEGWNWAQSRWVLI